MCRVDAFITHADMEAYAASLAISSATLGLIMHQDNSTDVKNSMATPVMNFIQAQMVTVKDTLVYQGMEAAFANFRDTPEYFCDVYAGRWGNAWQIVSTSLFCLLRAWRHSFEDAVEMAIKMGGDADTRGAIVGALKGAQVGMGGIPGYYKTGVADSGMLEDLDIRLWALGMGRE